MKGLCFALVLTFGCGAAIDDGPGVAPEDPAMRAFREHALPVFQMNCTVCHDGSTQGAPGFLAGDTPEEIRQTLLASGVISILENYKSPMFTKGPHAGPALSAAQVSEILVWL